MTVTRAYKVNPDIKFEVFIHKVDGLSDDHKIETQRDIHQRSNDDLHDSGMPQLLLRFHFHLPSTASRISSLYSNIVFSCSFYLTSIYDHSIFEAFSKVVQKLIVQLPTLENLLNIFTTVCFF